ncbi:MAG: hypothetical protein GMKNLPBB_02553 [Myxococcota bacterium]|nr:hypothetical protein [Myxococcota bacterium]
MSFHNRLIYESKAAPGNDPIQKLRVQMIFLDPYGLEYLATWQSTEAPSYHKRAPGTLTVQCPDGKTESYAAAEYIPCFQGEEWMFEHCTHVNERTPNPVPRNFDRTNWSEKCRKAADKCCNDCYERIEQIGECFLFASRQEPGYCDGRCDHYLDYERNYTDDCKYIRRGPDAGEHVDSSYSRDSWPPWAPEPTP